MNFLKRAQLVNVIVNEIIYVAPVNWSKIVYYTERLRDEKIGLRSKAIAGCWLGNEKIPHNNSKGPPLKSSVELFEAIDALFVYSEENAEKWSGFGVAIDQNGKYITQFYYEDTPLLDNKTDEYKEKLDALAAIN
ncbi:hypothetical protein LF296_06060 [Acinetobacter vivianii]|uniref:Uncharacterized protein n=1 Tax=Acinetobacter vivianii TaxID=1776742 RepID=A0AAJ6NL38_9GAMM|nr:hypothetical protein [Acinetobacter vivianii]WDZ52337.1 hypothetical protein LF296_06060 [Acinetobacter vivianii]